MLPSGTVSHSVPSQLNDLLIGGWNSCPILLSGLADGDSSVESHVMLDTASVER